MLRSRLWASNLVPLHTCNDILGSYRCELGSTAGDWICENTAKDSALVTGPPKFALRTPLYRAADALLLGPAAQR